MGEKEAIKHATAMKRLTFFSVSISITTTMTAILLVPSIYTYLQHVQSLLENEIGFCQHRSEGLYKQYSKIVDEKGCSN